MKETPLYMACEQVMKDYYELDRCQWCPASEHCNCKDKLNSHEQCIETLMNYFGSRTTVPDGWNVIQKIYDWCRKEIEYYQVKDSSKTNYYTLEKLKGRRKQARKTRKYIREIAKKSGVEVKDEKESRE